MPLPDYAELHCLTNFSFLRGASHAEELVKRAYDMGYRALAITDECSMAGAVRAHRAARTVPIRLIIGSEFRLDELHLVLLATDHTGYSQLCQLITTARRAAPKGEYRLTQKQLEYGLDHCLAIWVPADTVAMANAPARQMLAATGRWLKRHFAGRAWIGAALHRRFDDRLKLRRLMQLGNICGLPLTACGSAVMHHRRRHKLADTLTAIRLNTPVAEAGFALAPNAEQHLRCKQELIALYPAELLQESVRIAERCRFSLDELNYQYPHEVVPPGKTATRHLRELTEAGVRRHWPDGPSDEIRQQIEHELNLIAELRYESYFLTIHDIVEYARSQNILCQGRGSAANSIVCFCLGITAADPSRIGLLFERFISRERNEPPDIDVDFEHERREEVMQYVYRKYGRHRAALSATVITYRHKSAVRDVGKALGIDPDQLQQLSDNLAWWDRPETFARQITEAGFDLNSHIMKLFFELVDEICGFPRHLSQHVGGFVIAEQPLNTLVPVENATMPDRTVIQWDKDDLESLGLLKVDCLALGMLTALHRCFDLIQLYHAHTVNLLTIPEGDKPTYRMIQQADTIGVFQIESRAQQAMLPRLKPANYYDLVIEIAIVRPGPIQGNMVHPYLKRRDGLEQPDVPKPELWAVLEKTLGVPIFQEQAMKIAMVAAGFSAGEADALRRAMAAWKRRGGLEPFRDKLINGMLKNGYQKDYAERIYEQIKGFGDYGFPESHSASFAILAYASAYLKCHYPAAFTCALLNSQPMGFYSPAQLIKDAQRHRVRMLPVDVRYSDALATLTDDTRQGRRHAIKQPAIRLGLVTVKGLSKPAIERLVEARRESPFRSVQDLVDRSRLSQKDRHALARSGALRGLAGHRHRAYWQTLAARPQTGLLRGTEISEPHTPMRPPDAIQNLWADYNATGLSLNDHPMRLLRGRIQQIARRRTVSATALTQCEHGRALYVAGLTTNRQRPQTARGVIFLTLEDDTGLINVVVWPDLVERQRKTLLGARLMGVEGRLETEGSVFHLIAHRLDDHSGLIRRLPVRSRDFQ